MACPGSRGWQRSWTQTWVCLISLSDDYRSPGCRSGYVSTQGSELFKSSWDTSGQEWGSEEWCVALPGQNCHLSRRAGESWRSSGPPQWLVSQLTVAHVICLHDTRVGCLRRTSGLSLDEDEWVEVSPTVHPCSSETTTQCVS